MGKEDHHDDHHDDGLDDDDHYDGDDADETPAAKSMLNFIFIHSLRPSTTRYQTGTQFHALTSPERKPFQNRAVPASQFQGAFSAV